MYQHLSPQEKLLRPRDVPARYTRGPVPRTHFAAAASGCTNESVHKMLMADWYGLRPLKGRAWTNSARCAHWIVGKRCPDYPRTCELVRRWLDPRGPWDHARAWRTEQGDRVITLEPWGSPLTWFPVLDVMRKELRGIDVEVGFEGRAPYGSSYILFLAPAETEMGARIATIESLAEDHVEAALTTP